MGDEKDDHDGDVIDPSLDNPDPHFEPLVQLQPVETKTLEENEDELLRLRARMYRYDSSADPPEWKERGTGEIKLLHHKTLGTCRILMRRDKTLKICANHYVLPDMTLKPNCGSDKAWVWTTPADFADEETKPELLAARFANPESAQLFKENFEKAQKIMKEALAKDKHNTSASEQNTSAQNTSANDSSLNDTADSSNEGTPKKENKSSNDLPELDKLGSMTIKDNSSVQSPSKESDKAVHVSSPTKE